MQMFADVGWLTDGSSHGHTSLGSEAWRSVICTRRMAADDVLEIMFAVVIFPHADSKSFIRIGVDPLFLLLAQMVRKLVHES